MKINNLKLETSTMDLLVPLKTKLVVEQPNSSNVIDLKRKEKQKYTKKTPEPVGFDELLEKEIDKLK